MYSFQKPSRFPRGYRQKLSRSLTRGHTLPLHVELPVLSNRWLVGRRTVFCVSLPCSVPSHHPTLNIYFLLFLLFRFSSPFQDQFKSFLICETFRSESASPDCLSLGQCFLTCNERQNCLASIFHACSSLRLRESNSLVLGLGLCGAETIPA